jgi:hypothetical protein
MKVMSIVLLIALGSVFSACSVSTDKDGVQAQAKSQSLSYDLSENNCDTGNHSFSSAGDYCNGLQNDSLNNGCALSLRQAQFQTDCPGSTFRSF